MSKYLSFYGGARAISIIKKNGLVPEFVKVVAAAAGGPKWLILGHMDKVLFSSWFKGRRESLFLVGSSAGAWRLAAACQNRPDEALEKLKYNYINQWYPAVPKYSEISFECTKILDAYLGPQAVDEILNHSFCRLNILSVRSKGLLKSSNRLVQGAGLLQAVMANGLKRDYLKYFFQRVLFYHPEEKPPFYEMERFPIDRVPLHRKNFHKALLASGSIPLVMPGVEDIHGAPSGVYRDGGAIDYHPDLPYLSEKEDKEKRIVLFPHYTDRIIPGWLDKKLSRRLPERANMENVLMVSPTKAFVDLLPGGKIPDRSDFATFKGKNSERIKRWNQAYKSSQVLGEEFMEVVESGKIKDIIKPLKTIG
ncbi:MAG: patatin-like phospholipase family protein [Thermodesulfobacteriota bacterium]|nr:patatin-like phospholipase family protein [Thermodesulfobacteriota bacterium]